MIFFLGFVIILFALGTVSIVENKSIEKEASKRGTSKQPNAGVRKRYNRKFKQP